MLGLVAVAVANSSQQAFTGPDCRVNTISRRASCAVQWMHGPAARGAFHSPPERSFPVTPHRWRMTYCLGPLILARVSRRAYPSQRLARTLPQPQGAQATAAAGNQNPPRPKAGRPSCRLGARHRRGAWLARRSHSCATWTEARVRTRIAQKKGPATSTSRTPFSCRLAMPWRAPSWAAGPESCSAAGLSRA